ncbi:hypothetical protein FQN54_003201 [Arachnomyces sp. PD_36]|nr:hypothetical protein FQN54_003201 [Arachnomyces sp. PD_36]
MQPLISVLLSLGAFSAVGLGSPVWKRQDKTPVDEGTYENLSFYAGFPIISSVLAGGECPSPSNGVESITYIDVNETDTQAALWKSVDREEIIVGIPGTASGDDLQNDLDFKLVPFDTPNVDCAECQVHSGFLIAWNSLYPLLSKELTAALDANPGYSTVISGHSLGGGIATLAFASLFNGPFDVTSTYTYGQSRVGNPEFAAYIDSLSGASDTEAGTFFRVTHANDGIPILPPRIFGYEHSRTEYWESAEVADVATTYQCYGTEPGDCINTQIGLGPNPAHGSYAGMDVTCG